MKRKLKMGMVGGGMGGFIGAVHRMAANLDGKIELVAGAFSSKPEKSKETGESLFLDPNRVYASYEELAEKEAALPEGERVDFVTVVTRNNMHFPVARTLLKAGLNVICDKPVCFSMAEAKELRELVRSSGKIFALTHNYTGYPMVKQARQMVKEGRLGEILKVVVEYPQGYAVNDINQATKEGGQIDGGWRADPSVAGVSNCMGDIGSHAENLVRYITGLKIKEMCAELSTFVPGRTLDDDGNILVRYDNGAKGILYASQVSHGEENDLNIRVYGTKCSLEWHQENPNELLIKDTNGPRQTWRRGNDYVYDVAKQYSRLPFGHPEAFIEAFANIYLAVAEAVADQLAGNFPRAEGYDYPTIDDGVIGMAFIETAVKSGQSEQKWTPFPETDT